MKCFPIILILLGLAGGLWGDSEDDPGALFRAAQRSEAAGDSLNAYLLYARAAALEPGNERYAAQKSALQARVMQSAVTTLGAATPAVAADTSTPGLPEKAAEREAYRIAVEEISPSEAIEGQETIRPPRLKDPGTRQSFDLRGTPRLLFETVGEAFGIQVLFGPDYPSQGQSQAAITFRENDVTMEDAFRSLEAATNSFLVPLSQTQAEVFGDNMQNRTDNVPVISVAIPIPERISVEEAQEMATGIQQMMELRRIAVDANRHVIFIRDQEAKVMGARKILGDLARRRAQVAIEVEFLSMARNSALAYGMSLPTLFPIVNFGTFLNNIGAPVASVLNYATFGGGATLFGLGIADATGFATLSRSSAQTLIRTQMVALDGQKVTLHIGDRYPIITSRFGDPSGGVGTSPISQFTDLGLSLDITPVVHTGGEITLTLEAQYSALGASSNNGIPVISNRSLQSITRIKFGEWAVLAGLAVTTTGHDVTGIPLLSQIPWIGRVFRRNSETRDTGQTLIVLKPHLVGLPPWEEPTTPLFVGTETKPLSVY